MKRTAILALLLLCAACQRSQPPSTAARAATSQAATNDDSGQDRAEAAGRALLGRPGPALTLTTIDGERIDLAKFYGQKPVYLKFWATWCTPCREQMPAFEHDYQSLKDQMTIVAVNTGFNDSKPAIEAYRQRLGIHMPIVMDDGKLAAALNLRVTPQHVVIGRDGRILYVGHLEDERLHRALQAAIAERGGQAQASASTVEPVFGIGDAPTGLVATTLDGAPLRLVGPSADGKPRALVFFSPWCESYLAKSRPADSAACRRVRLDMNRLLPGGQADWIGIASGLWADPKDLRDYRASPGTAATLSLDESGRLFRAFDVHDVPTVVLIDAKGRIARKLGPRDTGLDRALAAVEKRS